ncbi:hypothetical protein V5799_014935 [Amblyomma americanum]|uniref:Uncharacterized protein n=1 Tax=Amblyomma americanum TaxID=6943 RepID=A0AAQ4E1K8_AMBAM
MTDSPTSKKPFLPFSQTSSKFNNDAFQGVHIRRWSRIFFAARECRALIKVWKNEHAKGTAASAGSVRRVLQKEA